MSLLRVLLAEDDEADRHWLCFVLRPLPCVVIQARNGTELEALLFGGDRFDVVITDICMPGPSGLEVAARARRAGITTPVIFVTSVRDETIAALIGGLGGAVLVAKPVSGQDLLDHVRHCLAFGSESQR